MLSDDGGPCCDNLWVLREVKKEGERKETERGKKVGTLCAREERLKIYRRKERGRSGCEVRVAGGGTCMTALAQADR